MPIKECDGDIFNESCIVCVANCTDTILNRELEPILGKLYDKYPEANVYLKRKPGTKGVPGTIITTNITTPNGKKTIITILGQYYAGTSGFPSDDPKKRIEWFKRAMIEISMITQNGTNILAFYSDLDGGGDWNKYLDIIRDMEQVMIMKKPTPVNIHIYKLGNSNSIINTKASPSLNIGLSSDAGEKVIFKVVKEYDNMIFFELISKYLHNQDWIYHLNQLPIDASWSALFTDPIISSELKTVDRKLLEDLEKYGNLKQFYPKPDEIFRTFNLCPMDLANVVIIGQDCYPGITDSIPHACGLSFSAPRGIKIPASLVNIYKALENDEKIQPRFKRPSHGDLTEWVKQGVMLLNVALTVRAGEAGSHLPIWKPFSEKLIKKMCELRPDLIFVLWGNPAIALKKIIKTKIPPLEYIHPSPLNQQAFIHCPHFSQINEILISNNKDPINWQITE